MKIKKFFEPVLESTVWFATDTTPEQLKNYIQKRTGKIAEGYDSLNGSVTVLDITEKNGGVYREYLVNVEKKKDFYTLLHETVHLVGQILDDRMIPIRKENDEIFAYYQTYWFKTLWRFMNKK